jgi:hypothetical protein
MSLSATGYGEHEREKSCARRISDDLQELITEFFEQVQSANVHRWLFMRIERLVCAFGCPDGRGQ